MPEGRLALRSRGGFAVGQRFLGGGVGPGTQRDPRTRSQPNPNGGTLYSPGPGHWERIRIVPMNYDAAFYQAPNAGYPGPPVNLTPALSPDENSTGTLRRAGAPNLEAATGDGTAAAGFPSSWAVWAVGAFLAWKFLKG